MNQAPKKITTIALEDKRGTGIRITLFLQEAMIDVYTAELAGIWEDVYGGKPDAVYINGKKVEAEFTPPDKTTHHDDT